MHFKLQNCLNLHMVYPVLQVRKAVLKQYSCPMVSKIFNTQTEKLPVALDFFTCIFHFYFRFSSLLFIFTFKNWAPPFWEKGVIASLDSICASECGFATLEIIRQHSCIKQILVVNSQRNGKNNSFLFNCHTAFLSSCALQLSVASCSMGLC